MSALREFVEEHLEDILEPYLELVRQRVERYAQADPETWPDNTRRMINLLPVAADDAKAPAVGEFVDHLVHERLPAGFELNEILEAMFLYKEVILPLIWQHESQPKGRLRLINLLDDAIRHFSLRFCSAYIELQMQMMDRQRQAMLELSTPVINVWDGILALPLIGTIDTYRARQIMDELLTTVAREQASVVLIDITGVPVVDTNVADHLIKTIHAAELLGTHCYLVGIGPELAQTIVGLGVDLRSITSTADMRQGLTLAFKRLGLGVVKV